MQKEFCISIKLFLFIAKRLTFFYLYQGLFHFFQSYRSIRILLPADKGQKWQQRLLITFYGFKF